MKSKWTMAAVMAAAMMIAGIVAVFAQVSTLPKEPYTKPQALTYNDTPTDVQIEWRLIWIRPEGDSVAFECTLLLLKGAAQIDFVVDGVKTPTRKVSVTEAELNAVLKTQGANPDFTDALTKAAVAKLPK